MHDALVLARLGLAAVFVVAGVAKLLDRGGSRRALVEFGVAERFADPLVVLLPLCELGTALALVFASTARWGGLAALALLAVFVLGLTRALRRGVAPDCHCFGQVHSEPASWATVARNVVLAVPAAFLVAAGPGPALPGWADAHSGQELWLIAASSLAALATAGCLVLWRQNRRLRSTQGWTAPPAPRIGARAPRFELAAVGGGLVTLQDLLVGGRPCLLTFVAPSCGPCATLLPEVVRWHDTFSDRLALPVVSAGGRDEAGLLASEYGLPGVLADAEAKVSRAYGVPGTPCSVLIGADGTVRSAPAAGQVAIEALVRLALQADAGPALVVHQVA